MGFEEIKCRYHIVDDYPNYCVTEHGDVYSYRTYGGWQGLRKLKKKGSNNPNRYLQVSLCKNGLIKYMQIHTLVARYFCDGYFDGAVVNHKDANIHNNDYTNLEWVTQCENIHKSYESSGVNQVRNYYEYGLYGPKDEFYGLFKGVNKAVEYAIQSGLDVSKSSLTRWLRSRGYRIEKVC